MLKHRIITALILIPIFVALVLFLPPIGFCFLTGIIVLWGAWEWSFFMGVKNTLFSFFYPLIMLVLLVVSLELPVIYVLYGALVWWLVALILVIAYPRASSIWGKSVLLRGLMGMFVLIPCWLALNFIRNEYSIYSILFLFVLIWGADIGAYFVGKKWGKNKLVPLVSPGKTWQGVIGALIVTIIIALGASAISNLTYSVWPIAILLAISTVLFSILGDLFESMLKRNVGLKDSGRLLPGHGGVLDRIDSLTAAAPIFVLGTYWLANFFH